MVQIFTGTQIIFFAFHDVSLDKFKNIDPYTLSFWQTIIYFNILTYWNRAINCSNKHKKQRRNKAIRNKSLSLVYK